uniref:Cytoplasmic dynein 2 heavy chain 1 n=1 Tax=Rhabditophanes sp. KR3021 TaxID=114890 RepID=A0AC35UGK5_9BILA
MSKYPSDSRRNYLLRIATNILSLNLTEEKLPNLEAIIAFCDSDVSLLVISRTEHRGKVEISNTFNGDAPALLHVIFYKNSSSPLDPDTYKTEVNVLSVKGNKTELVVGTVQNVLTTLFGKEAVQDSRPTHINLGSDNGLITHKKDDGSFTLYGEIRHWKKRMNTKDDPSAFWDHFEVLEEKFNLIGDVKTDSILAFAEASEDVIEGLWQQDPPYIETRMTKLIHAITKEIVEANLKILNNTVIWKSEKSLIDLNALKGIMDSWMYSIKLLTTKIWVNDPLHQWKSGEIDLGYFEILRDRVETIISLKSISGQVEDLVENASLLNEINVAIESTMRNFPVTSFSVNNESQWKAKVYAVDEALKPIMDNILPVLKLRIQPNAGDTSLLLSYLIKYKNFIARPKVKSHLRNELMLLVKRLKDMIEQRTKELLEYMDQKNMITGRYLTEIASKLLWVRQQIYQGEEMKQICNELMSDVPEFNEFNAKLKEFLSNLAASESELFDGWCREINSLISSSSSSLSLETSGRIMKMESEKGMITVSYSDKLVKLLREVRQLSSMGLTIPSKILNVAANGEKYYRHGIVLKQVAHFYNTIEQQMLPCQQAMMLEEALAFEKLIIPRKDGNVSSIDVTWDDPEKLELFIGKLQKAAQKLTTHNRRLRRIHEEVNLKVSEMMVTDLFKGEEKWKQLLNDIRIKVNDEKKNVGDVGNMRSWNIHIDHQLYKALHVQYLWGIESLHRQIPKMHVQLVFRENAVQFLPPFEDIKVKYFKELKKFISLPIKFKGVGFDENESSAFKQIMETNVERFYSLYNKTERLFDKVLDAKKPFEDWTVIGQVDLESLIEEKFVTALDWESQLKLLKSKAREIEKLPEEIKVDCIVISTNTIKATIDDLLTRLYNSLVWTLKHSILVELSDTSKFIDSAISTLNIRPQSIEEIAEANQTHFKLIKAQKEMKEKIHKMEEKNSLLRSVAGGGLDQLTNVVMQWEKLMTMLDNHQEMIKDQIEHMKSNVTISYQKLQDDGDKLFARWKQFKPKSDVFSESKEELAKAIEFIKEKRLQFDELMEQKNKLDSDCEQFNIESPSINILAEIDADIKESETNFIMFEDFSQNLKQFGNEEWVVFRAKTYLFEEFLSEWEAKLKESQPTHASVRIGKEIFLLKEMCLSLKFLRGEVLSVDHWLEIFRLLSIPKGMTLDKLKFNDLILVKEAIVDKTDELRNLNSRAQGEVAMREAIQEIELWAAQAEFNLTEYKHSNNQVIKIVKEWKESVNQVKDNNALLQSLKSSPYYKDFSDKTNSWEIKLATLDEFLGWMTTIQRKWIYLEPIFGRGSLPAEASRFNRVDIEFRSILNEIVRDKRLISLTSRKGLKNSLEQIIDQLNRCQKALNQFLEEKRNAFARFYFLGDDDLLEILGQSQNPAVIQSHLKKLFQGIDKVVMNEKMTSIIAMVSSDGENVMLEKGVEIVSKVEVWLTNLTEHMKETIKRLVKQCLVEEALDPSKYPSQVLCLCEEIRFCKQVEEILSKHGDLTKFHQELIDQLGKFTSAKVDDKILTLKLKALILDLIHHISVVEQLMAQKNVDISQWVWQKQLRFYFESNLVVVRMSNAQFEYTYEYQGNAQKLVHTPLTDKCYLTLTQALDMGLGGNPYGPAGTGKTESVKALASVMGRQVLVFNCDEGIDIYSMSRIFIGIVQCGAWGCFDEFNRLDQSVLSAVSMQISAIQNSISNHTGVCMLENKQVKVDKNSAIFVTLNPASKGYGGRQKLPDNLKLLFRPVVMSAPDNDLISETLLFSDGFKEAKILATKIVSVFKLSKETLSVQIHYDWGLRALKTILKGCGDMLANEDRNDPNFSEAKVVVQALCLNTLSKLTYLDAIKFQALLGDIFHDVPTKSAEFPYLLESLKKVSDEKGIALSPNQIKKIFELYEQLRQRMGVVIIGPSGSGRVFIVFF